MRQTAGSRTGQGAAVAAVLAAAATLLIATPINAATPPHMVKQLVAGPSGIDPGAIMGVVGSNVLFNVDASNGKGEELWRTNGTAAGTKLVRDINAGPDDSNINFDMVLRGSTAFFTANDGAHGAELWRSDGTRGGTKLVKDIDPTGSDGSYAFPWALMGGNIYLNASDGAVPGKHGAELWRTDGTPGGTKMVKDIRPGTVDSFIFNLSSIGSKVLFTANDGTHGIELFVSDGTKHGTHMVKEINEEDDIIPYPGGGFPPVVIGGIYYFQANDGMSGDAGDHGDELWRSDGTPGGTRMVKDISPGTASTDFQWAYRVGRKLYLSAVDAHGQELWVTNGKASGTHRVKDIWPGSGSSQPIVVGTIGSTLFFVATDGPTKHGYELWRTNGTAAGTRMVRDIALGAADSYPYGGGRPEVGTTIAGLLYFGATNGKGTELWRTNGTRKGTKMVADIWAGPDGSEPFWLTRFGKKLIFFADDGIHGEEVWTYTP